MDVQQLRCFTVCACENVCGRGPCSHKLMVGQIGAGNVNKASLLVHLSGWQRAYDPLKQSVMGEPNCWLYIHTCDVKLRGGQREGDKWGMGGTTLCKCVCYQAQEKQTILYNK